MHQFIGLIAIFATLAGVLHTWRAPRWIIVGLCVTGLVGVSAAVIGFQPRVIPSPVSQAQTLNAALQPVFEGVWDPLKPSQLLAPSR
ncbi:hypothetical protein SAMN02799622_05268 [Methylobacterium sp. UNC378MF]|jgi:hypothetical protein|nr:hypothetical protein SAMN02799622_05268 [Methylobacterium sp. UNC378MF]